MPRPLHNLSDREFESLIADLLGEELKVRFEAFTEGPDFGVDLRHIAVEGR